MGYVPFAPGTAGSLLALAVHWGVSGRVPGLWWTAILAGLFAFGVYASSLAERQWGKDPPRVVIDEIVGLFVAVMWLPRGVFAGSLAFVLFRAFDILKPFPAHRSERLAAGWGIMTDDLIAGVYANAGARLVLWLL